MSQSSASKQKTKKKMEFPSAYTILLGLMIVIALTTLITPGVKKATLADVVMAPITGMVGVKDNALDEAINTSMNESGIDAALSTINNSEGPYISVWNDGSLKGAIDVALFVLIIGGFLGVVTKTGALDAGVGSLVKKLKGKELMLIPILMTIFSLGGTSYGMAEESLAFYALITATMMAAGFDPIVGAATTLIGCGVGVLGSTVNPFAIGTAISASAAAGVEINQGITIILGVALWISTLVISILYVMNYAKKVYTDKGKSILSSQEMRLANESFGNNSVEITTLTGKQKSALILFTFAFVVMITSVIPWNDFGVTIFDNTWWFNGSPLGAWWFPELTVWFFIMAVVIGVVCKFSEKELVSAFVSGCGEMVGVALVIGISRGISFMMANSGLDLYILDRASSVLSGVSGMLFANMAYLIYIALSFLIPSTSGLASVSMPIFAPLAQKLSIAPEIVVAAFSAGSGIVNLITPTSGVVMGGLTISKIEYSTWIKFVAKLLGLILVATFIILSIGSMVIAA